MNADRAYLLHIRDAVERIVSYSVGGRSEFMGDPKTQDAILRNLEIVGEAAKRLSEETRLRASGVPWKAIAGMRDKLAHHYFGVDLAIVWLVVERDMPPLRAEVGRLLGEAE